MTRLNNPIKLLLIWLLGSVGVTIFLALIAGISTLGGEQWPLRIVSLAMILIPLGGLLLSLVSLFWYKTWSKKYWYIMLLLIILLGIPVFIYFC